MRVSRILLSVIILITCLFVVGCSRNTNTENNSKQETSNIEENVGSTISETSAESTDSIEYVESDKVVNSFSIGDAVFTMSQNWYFEPTGEEKTNYLITFEDKKPDNLMDFILVSYQSDAIQDKSTSQQVTRMYQSFLNAAYPGEVLSEESITRNDLPAYHRISTSNQDGTDITYNTYMFMANKTDFIMVSYVHFKDSNIDNTKEFMDFVRGIKTNASTVEMKDGYQKIQDDKDAEYQRQKQAQESQKKEPSIGMTEEEVLNSTWGSPKKKNISENEYGTFEQWVYDDGRYVYVDNGVVTSIQTTE